MYENIRAQRMYIHTLKLLNYFVLSSCFRGHVCVTPSPSPTLLYPWSCFLQTLLASGLATWRPQLVSDSHHQDNNHRHGKKSSTVRQTTLGRRHTRACGRPPPPPPHAPPTLPHSLARGPPLAPSAAVADSCCCCCCPSPPAPTVAAIISLFRFAYVHSSNPPINQHTEQAHGIETTRRLDKEHNIFI